MRQWRKARIAGEVSELRGWVSGETTARAVHAGSGRRLFAPAALGGSRMAKDFLDL